MTLTDINCKWEAMIAAPSVHAFIDWLFWNHNIRIPIASESREDAQLPSIDWHHTLVCRVSVRMEAVASNKNASRKSDPCYACPVNPSERNGAKSLGRGVDVRRKCSFFEGKAHLIKQRSNLCSNAKHIADISSQPCVLFAPGGTFVAKANPLSSGEIVRLRLPGFQLSGALPTKLTSLLRYPPSTPEQLHISHFLRVTFRTHRWRARIWTSFL